MHSQIVFRLTKMTYSILRQLLKESEYQSKHQNHVVARGKIKSMIWIFNSCYSHQFLFSSFIHSQDKNFTDSQIQIFALFMKQTLWAFALRLLYSLQSLQHSKLDHVVNFYLKKKYQNCIQDHQVLQQRWQLIISKPSSIIYHNKCLKSATFGISQKNSTLIQ